VCVRACMCFIVCAEHDACQVAALVEFYRAITGAECESLVRIDIGTSPSAWQGTTWEDKMLTYVSEMHSYVDLFVCLCV
jgi:hypothetical protein